MSFREEEPTMKQHSKNFAKVQGYYTDYLETGIGWNLERVRAAVGKWITPEEYEEITGESYQEGGDDE